MPDQVSGPKPLGDLKQRAAALVQIEADDELKCLLADWEATVSFETSRIERKETLSYHVKNEIYQLIGFFIVFQGVILTTVSQSNNLRCENWWSPFALSAIATIVTLGGVVLKSFDYVKWRNGAKQLQRHVKVLKMQINYLKLHGKDFDFVEHCCINQKVPKRLKLSAKDRIIAGIFVFLVVALIGFAAIVLVSCRAILCPP
ncbi:hypothetical protein M758_2G166800 [Ceratodon purpureus]|nr:hypothetical protein M758_2G166800 [Ceratodon purpureus]